MVYRKLERDLNLVKVAKLLTELAAGHHASPAPGRLERECVILGQDVRFP